MRKFPNASESRIDIELLMQSFAYMDEDGNLWYNDDDSINYVYNPT